ncbi:MAG: heme lyase CcmF/NrfE family subunit [Alphaproteobacteria bacterium]|nr:heme lyase CcmF/NrfE family subunit [Alphaproteobacteria bacterium]
MIVELGHFALVLGLMVALVQAWLPLLGAARGDRALMAVAVPAAQTQALLLLIAFFALMHAFVVSDFSVANVFNNSHTAKPLLYKVAGTWASHEGSMLLWVLILALFGAAVASFGRNLPPELKARALAVQGMIALAFLAFIVFTSNPFARIDPAPLEGRDLNPLLQDPGLAFHPPLLYLGYVGFSMAFSFAAAALIEGRIDAAWARWVRPWTLAAWACLTGGIALGSWWAYYELGWGGWWFWDPVENASFMPWLLGTALLHSAIVVEKRDTLRAWTILLAILTFSLSLMGTFLVRSGVLTSVHTFAADPARGLFILGILVIAIGGSLTLFAIRAPTLKSGGLFAPISREGGLLLNNLLLAAAAATVFIGTLYPLLIDALSQGGDKVSVGPPFFNATFVPIMIPLLLALAVGPMLAWKRGNLSAAFRRLAPAAAAAMAVTLLAFLLAPRGPVLAPFGLGLAAWLVVGGLMTLVERTGLFAVTVSQSWARLIGLPRGAFGLALAHAGIGIVVAGISGSAWQEEHIVSLKTGERLTIAGTVLSFVAVTEGDGQNYQYLRGEFVQLRGERILGQMWPERRSYPVTRTGTTEAAIDTSVLGDLYLVLGEGDESGAYTVRAYFNPLAPWMWIGALIMMFGGFVSLTDTRYRVGAPARAPSRAAVAAAAAAE